MKRSLLALGLCGIFLIASGCGTRTGDEFYNTGMKQMEDGDYKAAISTFKSGIEENQRLPETYRALGIAAMKAEDYSTAITAFSRSLNTLDVDNEEFKKDVQYYLASARIAYGDVYSAIEVYNNILKEGDDQQCYYFRGKAYLKLKDYENAGTDFSKAIENSNNYNMYINIYQAYVDANMSADGDNFLKKALELNVETADDYYNRAQIYYCQSDYESAREDLVKAIQKGYKGAGQLLLGKVYLAMGDVSNARALYNDYASSNGKSAASYNGLALCDITEENYDNALENIQKGIALGDTNEMQSLLFNEIIVYEYKRDFETAKIKIAQYLLEYPDDEQAQRENEFLKYR